jgi:hypothetical protein
MLFENYFVNSFRFVFAGKMKTIFDAEFASYMVRAKQKMETPDSTVDPLSQVVVAGGAGGKGTKRGRKGDAASTSNKVARSKKL